MDEVKSVDNPMRQAAGTQAKKHRAKQTARRHKKPSVEEAMRIRLLLHPSYIPEGGTSKDRRMYGCCTPTGRFWFRSCDWMDPFCEGRISTFVGLGSGPTSYWKNLKLLIWTFFIMTLFMLPALVINSFNQGEITALTLAQTTLAGLAPTAGADGSASGTVRIPIPGRSDPLVLTRGEVALIYSFCDMGACLVFFFAILYNRSFSKREERQVNKNTVTASDYSIFLPWVPRDTTENELISHFNAITTTDVTPDGMKVAEAHLVEDNTAVVSIFVERGRVFRQIERLQERIGRLEEAVRLGHVGCTMCFGGLPGTISRLKKFRELLAQRAEVLSNKATLRASKGTVAAFVTFEESSAVEFILAQYPKSLPAWCCQPKRKRLKGNRITILPAPPPASVLWSNLAVGSCEQRVRQTFTGLLTAIFLVGSFVLLWFASWKQGEYLKSQAVADCTSADVLGRISSGALNSTYADTLPPNSPDLYCYCGTIAWSSFKATAIQANPWSEKCPSFSCPAYFSANPGGIADLTYCVSFLRDRAITIALAVAASFAILFINSMLAVIMRLLTALEAHKSFEDLNASLQLRLFFAQFFNTALLMILVNVAWPGTTTLPEEFKTGKWSDLTAGWYNSVGVQMIITMLINCVTPHIPVLLACVMAYWKIRTKDQDAPSQRDLNERFVGPYADWSLRYAQLANIMTVTFVFSTGMPLMIPVGLVSFIASYWVDKMMFLWYFRRPPAFGSSVQLSFISLMPLVLVLHLAWGAWAISYGPLLDWGDIDPLRVQKYVGMASRIVDSYAPSVVSSGATRLLKRQSLPLFVPFLVMVAAMFLQVVMGSIAKFARGLFNFITCGLCLKLKFDLEKDVDTTQPTYSDACDPKLQGKTGAMTGLPSYNILLNPEIMSAFAISPEWAASHKTLSEVALYKIGNASMHQSTQHLNAGDKGSVRDMTGATAAGGEDGQGKDGAAASAPAPVPAAGARLAAQRARAAQRQRGPDGFGDGGGGYGFGDYDQPLDAVDLNETMRSITSDGGASRNDGRVPTTGSSGSGEYYDRDDTDDGDSPEADGNNLDQEDMQMLAELAERGDPEALELLENLQDQEFGGYMAGIAPSVTASSRRLNVSSTAASAAYRSSKTGPGGLADYRAGAMPGYRRGAGKDRPTLMTGGAGLVISAMDGGGKGMKLVSPSRRNVDGDGEDGTSPGHGRGLSLVQQAAEDMQHVVSKLVRTNVAAAANIGPVDAEMATTAAAMLILLRQSLATIPADSARAAELNAAIAHLSTFVTLEALVLDTASAMPPAVAAVSPSAAQPPSPWAMRTAASARLLGGAGGGAISPTNTRLAMVPEGGTLYRNTTSAASFADQTPVVPYDESMPVVVTNVLAQAQAHAPSLAVTHSAVAMPGLLPPPPPPPVSAIAGASVAVAVAAPMDGVVVQSALRAATQAQAPMDASSVASVADSVSLTMPPVVTMGNTNPAAVAAAITAAVSPAAVQTAVPTVMVDVAGGPATGAVPAPFPPTPGSARTPIQSFTAGGAQAVSASPSRAGPIGPPPPPARQGGGPPALSGRRSRTGSTGTANSVDAPNAAAAQPSVLDAVTGLDATSSVPGPTGAEAAAAPVSALGRVGDLVRKLSSAGPPPPAPPAPAQSEPPKQDDAQMADV